MIRALEQMYTHVTPLNNPTSVYRCTRKSEGFVCVCVCINIHNAVQFIWEAGEFKASYCLSSTPPLLYAVSAVMAYGHVNVFY